MASPSPSQSGSQGSGSGSASPSTTSIPASAPAGLITITQPPQTATSYYKIASGEVITFAWNTSYVLVQPTSLTLSAICDNGNTYPVGPTNGHILGTASSVTWDLWSYQQNNPQTPLAQQMCTLHIWGDQGPGVQRSPGVISENNQLQFAMYSPQAYTPLINWTCPQCNTNASLSDYATHPASLSLLVTIVVMFLSGWHLLRMADH
ncbi:hypothetical protein BDY19DRAFT_890596 [Irpex rosettiformis]|uniref:Uncharacterized protein n=1 Tax=Irpex rosettiformis TaxID=378272 RepID=A0ACB8U3F0_9APHY|nr:hypothetical protein BDY19DRAFT_890596 [Irpex rosettiformis]